MHTHRLLPAFALAHRGATAYPRALNPRTRHHDVGAHQLERRIVKRHGTLQLGVDRLWWHLATPTATANDPQAHQAHPNHLFHHDPILPSRAWTATQVLP